MRNSHFFRRIFTLIVTALILWMILTALLYAFIARPVFENMKIRELEPQARMLARRAGADYRSLDDFVQNTVRYAYEMYGNYMFLVDVDNDVIIHTALPDSLAEARDDMRQTVMEQNLLLLTTDRNIVSRVVRIKGERAAYLFVAVPIASAAGIHGSLVIVQSMAEINAGIVSLNLALFVSSFLVLIVMIFPAMLATFHLLRPLQSIREVAVAMSRGDFSQRADETQKGEFQDLARAVNHLAGELSTVISELTLERNRLRQIIDGIAEGIIAVDRDGRITQFNAKVWEIFAVDSELIEPFSPDLFLKTTHLHDFFQEAIDTSHSVHHVISKDHRQIACLITPLMGDGEAPDGAVGLFRDITESERLEQTRRDYIANVSHELRTPLTAMRALLEPLSENMVKREEDRRRYYDILLSETVRLSRLINDMLELSRLQAPDAAVSQEIVDPTEIVLQVLERFSTQARDKKIELVAPTDLENCPLVWSNPDRLEQILIILLDNAFKFTPQGGRIAIAMRPAADTIDLDVQDNGVGIDPEDLDHVFDRFYKADKSHNEPGTGLGLSIASEIARQMHVRLSVKSEPGQGARFTLRLPRAGAAVNHYDELKEVFAADSGEGDAN